MRTTGSGGLLIFGDNSPPDIPFTRLMKPHSAQLNEILLMTMSCYLQISRHLAGVSWLTGSLANVLAPGCRSRSLPLTSSANKRAALDCAWGRWLSSDRREHLTQYWRRGKRLDLVSRRNSISANDRQLIKSLFASIFRSDIKSRIRRCLALQSVVISSICTFANALRYGFQNHNPTKGATGPLSSCIWSPKVSCDSPISLRWAPTNRFCLLSLLESTNPSHGHHQFVAFNSVPSTHTAFE